MCVQGQPGLQELVPGQVPKLQRNTDSKKKKKKKKRRIEGNKTIDDCLACMMP